MGRGLEMEIRMGWGGVSRAGRESAAGDKTLPQWRKLWGQALSWKWGRIGGYTSLLSYGRRVCKYYRSCRRKECTRACVCVCVCREELRFRALNLKQIYRGGRREEINVCNTLTHKDLGAVGRSFLRE